VHIFERAGRLGGQLNLASAPPNREEIGTLLEHYKREVKRLHVQVHLDEALTVEKASALEVDAIVVAVGARAVPTTLPGSDLPHVTTGWEVLSGMHEPGLNCVVVGGALSALKWPTIWPSTAGTWC
jgi:NADPH-dependent 2,4-dienoyl-CoA reductase/sulfur reductase-like enzyme